MEKMYNLAPDTVLLPDKIMLDGAVATLTIQHLNNGFSDFYGVSYNWQDLGEEIACYSSASVDREHAIQTMRKWLEDQKLILDMEKPSEWVMKEVENTHGSYGGVDKYMSATIAAILRLLDKLHSEGKI